MKVTIVGGILIMAAVLAVLFFLERFIGKPSPIPRNKNFTGTMP
ncbi:MAG TPA: hypothetical protein VOA64_13285 [Candidatus Dormibacteraeota bacterium]|nr:hypothetical protein [Candidatus Dormibacteraeota bacterium]